MSNKLLIKIVYVAIIIVSIVMAEFISENFIVIPKIIFWFESIIVILGFFISYKNLQKDWKYMSNFHMIWNLSFSILSCFFIAYKGWFVLLCFFIPTQIIAFLMTVELNKRIKNKDSTND